MRLFRVFLEHPSYVPTTFFGTFFTALKELIVILLFLSLQLVLRRVAILKSLPVHHPLCSLYLTFSPLRPNTFSGSVFSTESIIED